MRYIYTRILAVVCALALILCIPLSRAEAASAKLYTSERLQGKNRYGTALSVASAYGTSFNSIVIATGNDFPDALSGSVLAKKLNVPILLVGKTPADSIDTVNYIKAHVSKSGMVYILGGTGVIPETIINTLSSAGFTKFDRIGGTNRVDTSVKVAQAINPDVGAPVVIATEHNFPDALSISSIAANKGYPILLSDKNALPSEVISELSIIKPNLIYIIGGTGVISDGIKSKLKVFTSNVTRLYGSDRYATSLYISSWFKLSSPEGFIATGNDFPDALAGSVLAAKDGAPILLVGSNPADLKKYLDGTGITKLYVLGGTGAVSSDIEGYLDKEVSDNTPPTPTPTPTPTYKGLQTANGVVSGKITYPDNIPDNPTRAQMDAISTYVTNTSNPEIFSYTPGNDYWNMDLNKMNLTGKIYHSQYTVHYTGGQTVMDEYDKILSMHIGAEVSEVGKVYTQVYIISNPNGDFVSVSRKLIRGVANSDYYNYIESGN